MDAKSGLKVLVALLVLAVLVRPQRAAAAGDANGPFRYQIEYATLIGGSEYDDLREVIPLADGSVLVGGQTVSMDFPVTEGVFQPKYGREPAGTGNPGLVGGDCWVGHLSADGKKVLAATYFGGSKQERDVYGMALDSNGNIVITTTSRSQDIPTTEGAFQRKHAGGAADWVVAKISPDLKKVLWCTYVGGSGEESPRGGLAVDREDNVYVVGTTSSADFPTTKGAFQTARKGSYSAAVAKLKPDGSGLVWSTLLGGGKNNGILGVRVDARGNVYVAGHTDANEFPVTEGAPQPAHGGASDSFVAALSADGNRLLYSTFLGGRGNEFTEHRLALLADGSVVVPGVTASPDFPGTARAFQRALQGQTDGFVTRLSADGKKWIFSTFLGGTGGEFLLMPTTDPQGNIYVVGHTNSKGFPVTPGAIQATYGGGDDGVFGVLSPDGSRLLYATYLGGKGEDLLRSIALGPKGEVYLVGKTASDDFPATAGAAQSKRKGNLDAFVVKLVPVR